MEYFYLFSVVGSFIVGWVFCYFTCAEAVSLPEGQSLLPYLRHVAYVLKNLFEMERRAGEIHKADQ